MSILVPQETAVPKGKSLSFRSSTANAWGQSFIRHLRGELEATAPQVPLDIVDKVGLSAQLLFNEQYKSMPDASSYTVLGVCALVLSAYRELAAQLGSTAKAFDVVERSFKATYQAFILNVCKPLVMGSSRTPRSLAQMNFRSWGARMYQASGSTERERRRNAKASEICAYHQFFMEQNEPSLSHIVHGPDQAWIEMVSVYGTPEFAERRRQNANNSGFAPFQFAPHATPRAEHKPAVVLKLHVGSPDDGAASGRQVDTPSAGRRRGPRGKADEQTWAQRETADRRSRSSG